MAVGGKGKEHWKRTAEAGIEGMRIPSDDPAVELDTWCQEIMV